MGWPSTAGCVFPPQLSSLEHTRRLVKVTPDPVKNQSLFSITRGMQAVQCPLRCKEPIYILHHQRDVSSTVSLKMYLVSSHALRVFTKPFLCLGSRVELHIFAEEGTLVTPMASTGSRIPGQAAAAIFLFRWVW